MSRNLNDLHPKVKEATLLLIKKCKKEKNIEIIVTQTTRSEAEQQAFYSRGRLGLNDVNVLYKKAGLAPITAAENKSRVTNAKSVKNSFHAYGVAVDFAVMINGKTVLWDSDKDLDGDGIAEYKEVGIMAESLGFEWGGRWSSIADAPHIQMRFGLSIEDYQTGKRPK